LNKQNREVLKNDGVYIVVDWGFTRIHVRPWQPTFSAGVGVGLFATLFVLTLFQIGDSGIVVFPLIQEQRGSVLDAFGLSAMWGYAAYFFLGIVWVIGNPVYDGILFALRAIRKTYKEVNRA